MKRIKILIAAIIIIVVVIIISAISNNNIADNYPPEYKQILKSTEYCVGYSDTALVAEYVSSEEKDTFKFKVTEIIFGEFVIGEEFTTYIPAIDNLINTEILINSSVKHDPDTDYMYKYWYIDNLLVDLTPGEKYLIFGEEIYPYKGIKRLKQYVMHYTGFSITDIEKLDIEKPDIENPDKYLSVTEYVKYIDKRYGHGSKEW